MPSPTTTAAPFPGDEPNTDQQSSANGAAAPAKKRRSAANQLQLPPPPKLTPVPSSLDRVPLDGLVLSANYLRLCAEDHADNLMRSIRAIGLLAPLVVDRHDRVIAGQHRHRAILNLRQRHSEEFAALFPEGRVPVLRLDFDSAADPVMAFAVETSENTLRLWYNDHEVVNCADRFKSILPWGQRGLPAVWKEALVEMMYECFGWMKNKFRRALEPQRTGWVSHGGLSVYTPKSPSSQGRAPIQTSRTADIAEETHQYAQTAGKVEDDEA